MFEEPKFIKRFRIVVAKEPDKDYSVCEIYYQHEKWAVIEQKDIPVVRFCESPNGKVWELPLEEAINALQKAKRIFD